MALRAGYYGLKRFARNKLSILAASMPADISPDNPIAGKNDVLASIDLLDDTVGWIGKNEVDVAKYNHISTNCVANAVGDVMTFTAPITATGQYAELSYYASQTSDVLFDHNVKRKMMIIVSALTSNKAAIGLRNSENRFIKSLKFESAGTYILDLSDVTEDYYVGVYPRWEYNNAEASVTFKLMVYDARLDNSYESYHASVAEVLDTKMSIGRLITSADDLDTIFDIGIYRISTAPTHSPEGSGYCTLEVLPASSASVIQRIQKANIEYSRFYNVTNQVWENWNKFTGTEITPPSPTPENETKKSTKKKVIKEEE